VGERAYFSIGDVLAMLREEFPDVTISKIRFLESRGLLDPERTPSGYRKFYPDDVERLRWILRQQREHYLPLRVIKGRLETGALGRREQALFDREVLREGAVGRGSVTDGEGAPTGAPLPPRALEAALVGVAAVLESEVGGSDRPVADGLPTDHGASSGEGGGGEGAGSLPTPPPPRPAASPESPSPRAAASVAPGGEPARAGAGGGEGGRRAPSGAEGAGGAERAGARRGARGGRRSASASERSAGGARDVPGRVAAAVGGGGGVGRSLAELAAETGSSPEEIEALESFGLIEGRLVAGVRCYDDEAFDIARLAAGFREYGIEARHLRTFKHAAERTAGLFAQVVTPLLRQRNPESHRRAVETLERLAELAEGMEAALLAAALRELVGR